MKIKCRPCCVDKFKEFIDNMKHRHPKQIHVYDEVQDLLINSSLEVINDGGSYKTENIFNYVEPDEKTYFCIERKYASYMYEVKE